MLEVYVSAGLFRVHRLTVLPALSAPSIQGTAASRSVPAVMPCIPAMKDSTLLGPRSRIIPFFSRDCFCMFSTTESNTSGSGLPSLSFLTPPQAYQPASLMTFCAKKARWQGHPLNEMSAYNFCIFSSFSKSQRNVNARMDIFRMLLSDNSAQ